MNCIEREDNLYLLAVDALEGADRVELQIHLGTGCPTCSGVYASAVAVTVQMGVAKVEPEVRPSLAAKQTLDRWIASAAAGARTRAGVGVEGLGSAERERLMLRPEDAATDRSRRPRRYSWGQLAIAAGIAALLTAGPVFFYRTTENNMLRHAVVVHRADADKANGRAALAEKELTTSAIRLASAEKMLADIQTALTESKRQNDGLVAENKSLSDTLVTARLDLAATQQVAQMLASKKLLMLDLKGMPDAPAGENAQARLLVDLQHKIWRLYTADLKPVPNKVFEFWLVTSDGTKVPMGSFTTDEKGAGVLTGNVPDPMPALAIAAVSDEPGPGAKQPTGQLHVVGKFQ